MTTKKPSAPVRSIRLAPSKMPRLTKFGGNPNLPEAVDWPVTQTNCQMDFAAQIHLPELSVRTALPKEGTLFFFYTDTQNWKVIYTAEPLPETVRKPASGETAPRSYSEAFRLLKPQRSSQCRNAPHYQMLGAPYCLQHEHMAPGYRLLLQLDSDLEASGGPGWHWGDAGLIYFFIKPQALKDKNFDSDNIKVIWECC